MTPNQPVIESIEQRILELLGLEETFDLDYGTYFTLLKEALVKYGVIGKEKIPNEDLELLKSELKRIKIILKNEKKTKKFKINREKFFAKKEAQKTTKISIKKLLLPGSAPSNIKEIESKSKLVRDLKDTEKEPTDILSRIDEKLSSILETLLSISKIENKQLERDRKNRENRKRQERESGLEKGKKIVGAAVQKIIKPFQSIFDRVWNFIKFTLLGRAFTMLMNWFADPKNKGKVETLGRFLKDWWPALLFAVTAFTTPFGGLVRTVIGLVTKWTFKIAKFAIPKLLSIVRKNPRAAAAVALFTAGATIPAMFPETVNEQERKTKAQSGSNEEKIKALEVQKANLNPLQKIQGVGSEIDEQIYLLKTGKTKGYFGGAYVSSGVVDGQSGIDKVPAMLTNGEFVISRGAVDKYGVAFFERLNAAGGGTNKPKTVKGVTYAATGGPVGNVPSENKPYRGFRQSPDNSSGKDDIKNIKQLIKRLTGYDVDKPFSWPKKEKDSNPKPNRGLSGESKTPTGSLLNDPVGALRRITGIGRDRPPSSSPSSSAPKPRPSNSKTPTGSLLNDPIGALQRITGIGRDRPPSSSPPPPSSVKTSGEKNEGKKNGLLPGPVQEVIDKLQGPGSSTYRDAGGLYLKQMFGGYGGPISERDLSKESKDELQKAIERAKKRTGTEIETIQAKIKKLKADGAENTVKGRQALANEMSFLKKLKAGGIRVKYQDYADERGKMSESAENAKNILGQFWAYGRKENEGGGYRIEDTYDFDMFKKDVKDPKTGKTIKRDFNVGELITEGIFGKGKTIQQRLQAAYLLNPLKGKGDVDMILGGKRSSQDELNLSTKKAIASGGFGAALLSGAFRGNKPKDKNTQALEAKRPWWDKFGLFGGASGQMERERQYKKDFEKKNPGVTLYNKSKSTPKPSAKSKPSAKPTVTKVPPKPKPYVGKARRRNSGGFLDISTNFGVDTSVFGPDTQYSPTLNAAFQPGEGLVDFDYVLTKDAMMNGAREQLASYAQNLNSSFDSDSNARKQGIVPKDVSLPKITPYSSSPSTMSLPPIKSSSGGSMSVPTSRSSVPEFSVIPSDSIAFREANAKLLGLVA